MCYSQYPSEGLDLLNKIKNIEVYMGNDNTKALSGMDMTTGSIPVKILKFSIPLMLAQILEVLFNMLLVNFQVTRHLEQLALHHCL